LVRGFTWRCAVAEETDWEKLREATAETQPVTLMSPIAVNARTADTLLRPLPKTINLQRQCSANQLQSVPLTVGTATTLLALLLFLVQLLLACAHTS